MNLYFKKSQSSVKPELVDTTSSKKVVYIRQNIVETFQSPNGVGVVCTAEPQSTQVWEKLGFYGSKNSFFYTSKSIKIMF